jgi:NAD(P)-dependent dehydrogenase (short-subunit alcohol dehydrogenase family)
MTRSDRATDRDGTQAHDGPSVSPERAFLSPRAATLERGEMAKSVLITGANSGIGRAAAELLAARGYRVFATMRDLDKGRDLEKAAKDNGWDLKPLQLDVRDEASVKAAFAQAGDLDVLVNNAGFEVWGPLDEMTVDDLVDQFETNVYGPFRCIRAVLPAMRTRGGGVIVNLSSVAGRVAAPLNGAYAASKWALEALSESLHYEVGHFGVRIHIVEPGAIETSFPANRRLVGAGAGDEASPYREMVTQWQEAQGRLIPGGQRTQPSVVAEVILEAIETGDKLRYPAGQDAQMVLMARRQMDDETFESTMRQRLGLTW